MRRLRLHILFWIIYLLFVTYIEFAWISSSFASVPVFRRWLMAMAAETTMLSIKIPLSYFMIDLINNLAYKIRRPLLTIAIGVAAFAAAVVLHRLMIIQWILPHMYNEATNMSMLFQPQRMISSLLDLILVVGIVVAIKQYFISQRARQREQELIRENLSSELQFLKAQTNPHFLFNTLNNIYALARKKADETPAVVMKLSKLLRFMLYGANNSQISIQEELRVLQDYIELEEIRYNDRLEISFARSIDNESEPIAPLILLPFVENAFKHGASETRFNSFVRISLQLEKGNLHFTVENSKEAGTSPEVNERIGLGNVRRQLELLYPSHTLDVENGNDVFKITLQIKLSDHANISMPHHRG